jgi:hypothetical protein
MKLPGNVGTLDFGDWAYGLASAFISGGATAITGGFAVGISDGDHFNVHTPALWTVMGIMFVVSGVSNGANFLRNRPLPAFVTSERTVEKTEIQGKPAQVVTTSKETVVQPVETPALPAPKP